MGAKALHLGAIAGALITALTVRADVPNETNFQGRLVDSGGAPLAGPVDIEIGVWTQLVGGTRLYREFHQNVELRDGVFDVVIGTGSFTEGSYDPDTFAAADRFLEVVVDAETLSPRQPFDTVGYAFQASVAANVSPGANLNLSFTDYNATCNFGNDCPVTATSAVHNFCALTRFNQSPPGTFSRCTVTANGDGTFELEANASGTSFLECRMSCF